MLLCMPPGEWLCWPCKRFEEGELRAGKSQNEIRPPRWEQGPSKHGSPNKDLVGGGRSVGCHLCPIKRGAFRQTTDGKYWVHQVRHLNDDFVIPHQWLCLEFLCLASLGFNLYFKAAFNLFFILEAQTGSFVLCLSAISASMLQSSEDAPMPDVLGATLCMCCL